MTEPNRVDKILDVLDHALQHPGDDAYPTELGQMLELCWRCQHLRAGDTVTGLCGPCVAEMQAPAPSYIDADGGLVPAVAALIETTARQLQPLIDTFMLCGQSIVEAFEVVMSIGGPDLTMDERLVESRRHRQAHDAGACLEGCAVCQFMVEPMPVLVRECDEPDCPVCRMADNAAVAEGFLPPPIMLLSAMADRTSAELTESARAQGLLPEAFTISFDLGPLNPRTAAVLLGDDPGEPPGPEWVRCPCDDCGEYRAAVRAHHERIRCGGCEVCVGLS